MKIVIMAGGTGSIALQTGLYNLLKERTDQVDVKVIVNAYDNGLSTGAVRKVLGGRILGPSDVRKNQTTRYALEYGIGTPLLKFLDHRFTAESSKAQEYALDILAQAKLSHDHEMTMAAAIKTYFLAPTAIKIDYTDFSVANIVYAGLAAMSGNSLRNAARVMAGILGIQDNVLLNDDTSLFLGAITQSGKQITDEGDIVSWNNPADPIVDIFFTNAEGAKAEPVLCDEAKQAMREADVIILSSGTQWSSLIPTYASKGFAQTMANFQGRVLMVMNRVPDKDAPGQSADDIVNTLVPKYFPNGMIDLVLDNTGPAQMSTIKTQTARDVLRSVNSFDLKHIYEDSASKHMPGKLAHAVVKTIFREYLDGRVFMFDYDDTLVGRGNTFPKSSAFNRTILRALNNSNTAKVAICTGNSIRAINVDGSELWNSDKPHSSITVYADGGVNKYEYNPQARVDDEEANPYTFIECVAPAAQFAESGSSSAEGIISAMRAAGIPTSKIENRGNVMLSIKPIDPEYREIVRQLVLHILYKYPPNRSLRVKSAGRSTVEIASEYVSKSAAVQQMIDTLGPEDQLVFIGDEFDGGNDASILELSRNDPRVKCVRVKNPADTALLLTALTPYRFPL